MKEKAENLAREFARRRAVATDEKDWEELRRYFLGRKGRLSTALRELAALSPEERKTAAPPLQKLKKEIIREIESALAKIAIAREAEKEWIDVTLPGEKPSLGHLHPLTLIERQIGDIFSRLGFAVVDGPEVETEFYNFDAVNVPPDHPARDMQDTFWIESEKPEVLRTHTSNIQVRYMRRHKPPFRIIVPGRVFRNEATDATHEHTFHQFEALMVDENISVADFLAVAEKFFSEFFAAEVRIRLRPSFFPFVEPGFEFDISCTACGGEKADCRTCRGGGWLEVGGAGMVHPRVFAAAGYEKGRYTGFAWGFGLERLAMIKYKIDDIRLFHGGDKRFSRRF